MPNEKITFYIQEEEAKCIDDVASVLGLKRSEIIKSSLSEISSKDFDDMCNITKLEYLERQCANCIKFFEMKPIVEKDDISRNFPAYVVDWGSGNHMLSVKYPTYAIKVLNAKDLYNNEKSEIEELIETQLPVIYHKLVFAREMGVILTQEFNNDTYTLKKEDALFLKIYFMEYQKSECGNALKKNLKNAQLVKNILQEHDFQAELWGEKYLINFPVDIIKMSINADGNEETFIRIK